MEQPAARLIRRTVREQWRLLVLAAAGNLGRALLEGASLAVVYLAVEVAGRAQVPTRLFAALILAALALRIAQALLHYLSSVSVGYLSARCSRRIQALIHQRILAFSFGHASGYRVGDLTELAASAPAAVDVQITAIHHLATLALLGLTYLVVLVSLSPWLLLAAAAIGAVVVVLQRHLLPRVRHSAFSLTGAGVAISSRLTEDIQALRLLHSLGQLQPAADRFQAELAQQERERRRQSRLTAALAPLDGLLPTLVVAVIALVSVVVFGSRGAGFLPSLVTFVLTLQRLNTVLNRAAEAVTSLSANAADLDRLNRFLLPAGKQFRRLGGRPFTGLHQGVRFEGVGLRHGADQPWVLRAIDLEIPRGRTVALVGPSGAGKSSIADLLTGLYEPSEGRILIDGVDLQTLDLASWQRRLGVVSQDTVLFNASVGANIAFGCPGASRAAIEAAAERALAAGFIAELPEGYDTLLGERGHRLSGGQRQRLSLARALLRDPGLLILDEATSALDSRSERMLQQALSALEPQPTLLVIAHRVSTVRHADLIVVLDCGRIVDRGRHHDLLRHPQGLYRQLWGSQGEPTGSPQAPSRHS
ncbi:MAG: ABC transporter ATP-binding protein/permease [Synechococcaceae cyanobacterium]